MAKMSPKNIISILMIIAMISCVFIGESMAGKKGDDIILYNGNIVMRGKKGKGGSIVLANSPGGMDGFPYFGRR